MMEKPYLLERHKERHWAEQMQTFENVKTFLNQVYPSQLSFWVAAGSASFAILGIP